LFTNTSRRPKAATRRLHEVVDLRRVGHVRLHGQGFSAARADFRRELVQAILAPRRQDNARACARERERARAADPRRRAG
jgi:hypothetical protein